MPITPTTDRALARDLLGTDKPLDDDSAHVLASDDAQGAVTWYDDLAGVARLGAVATTIEDRRLFYELVRQTAIDAKAAGYTRASFIVHDARLLALLQRDFRIEPDVLGTDLDTGKPAAWRVTVDLDDALVQLDARLPDGQARLGPEEGRGLTS